MSSVYICVALMFLRHCAVVQPYNAMLLSTLLSAYLVVSQKKMTPYICIR